MKIAVVGAYQTAFGELWDKSLEDIMQEAITGCLDDGDLQPQDVQAVYVGNMLSAVVDQQQHLSGLIPQILQRGVPVTRVEAACASGGMAVRTAALAINAGIIETALVIGAEKMTDVDSHTITQALMGAAGRQEAAAGLSFPGLYALMAQRYFQTYGINQNQLSYVSVKNHHHAALNKTKAHFPFAVTQEQVLQSPAVASPLTMLDCSPISDGAAAVFLSSEAWCKRFRKRNGVCITGSAHANDVLSLADRATLLSLPAVRQAKENAFEQASIEAQDISCLEVHDCFSIAEVLALEDLGICAEGEGHTAAAEKHSWLGNSQPVNTSGGLKACGHPVGATGVKQIVELTQQLRGEAKNRQVNKAQVGVAHNVGGTGGTAVVHVLTR